MARRVIAVTGLPGAWLNTVTNHLKQQGMLIAWPGQDLDIDQGRDAYERGENPELVRIHETILGRHNTNWFTRRAPRYYDIPYPGPDEYLAKFPAGADVVLADPRLVLFFPMWNHRVSHLFICGIPPEIAAKQMQLWLQGRAALDLCNDVAQHYRERMHETVTAAMDRHTRLPYDHLRDGRFAELVDSVLKTTF